MSRFLSDIDQLLRGGFTRPTELAAGRISLPVRTLVLGSLALGCIYGAFMGIYGVLRPSNATVLQLLATTLKVPLLFLLTLIVSFPSLYVLSALAGSRLRFRATLRLLLAAVAVNLALLASLGPVVGFFTLSTESYAFMLVLNVGFFGVSGIAGLVFLRRALGHVFADDSAARPVTPEPAAAVEPSKETDPPAPETPPRPVLPRTASDRGLPVFRAWLVIYGVVGAQMGWILRPFVGSPDLPFELFRQRESNFLQGLINALTKLFS